MHGINRLLQLMSHCAVCWGCIALPCQSQDSPTPWEARPEVVQQLSQRRGEFNYEESKVPAYTLPNALVTLKGQSITDAEDWHTLRRPELMELFRNSVYG